MLQNKTETQPKKTWQYAALISFQLIWMLQPQAHFFN